MNAPVTMQGNSRAVVGLAACYALGTFTDNFYKQCAILLAASLHLQGMQSTATMLFSLPFIAFSAWAGALADRLPKRSIVIGIKTLEFVALAIGGIMLVNGWWGGILVTIFLLGVQSTFFSPAINGSIPEAFPPALVPRANSFIKLTATAAILAGMAGAGFFLDMQPGSTLPFGIAEGTYGRFTAAVFLIFIALLGLASAFFLRKFPAVQQEAPAPFPWAGPIDSFKHLIACRKDPELFTVLLAEAWFYGIAAVAVISIANLTLSLGYGNSTAGILTALLMVGIAAGALYAGKFPAEKWRSFLLPAGSAMSVMLALTGFAAFLPEGESGSLRAIFMGISLLACGVFGGIYLIPLSSFIQIRPAAGEKGRVIAASNFFGFVAMGMFGGAFSIISLLPPEGTFFVYGALTLGFLTFLAVRRLPRSNTSPTLAGHANCLIGRMLQAILALRYRVTVKGLETIAYDSREKCGMLILPNHPALIDPVIVYSRFAGLRPRPLADENQMKGPVQQFAARLVRAVTIPDMTQAGREGAHGVKKSMEEIAKALRRGENVLVYPAGRIYLTEMESLRGNSAVATLLAAVPETRVIIVRTKGLWGSSFSMAPGTRPVFIKRLAQGFLTLLGNAFFFAPRRKVELEVREAGELHSLATDKMALNHALESFYNGAQTPPLAVRRFFWHRGLPSFTAPAAAGAPRPNAADSNISQNVYSEVCRILSEHTIAGEATDFAPDQRLSADLGLDSLAIMEAAAGLEEHFGTAINHPEKLETVLDCCLAAEGRLEEETTQQPVHSQKWLGAFAPIDSAPQLTLPPKARTFMEAFLTKARQAPNRPLTADAAQMRSRKDVLTGVLALARRFEKLPGKRLGIMLPASPAALAIWLAVLHAGKTPVFINWTVGRRNLEHCLAATGITHAVSSSRLLERLSRTGVDVYELPITWVAAESTAKSLSLPEKLLAAAAAALHCSPLPFALKPGDTGAEAAAILFTSGSEALPKAVPLTHMNIMCNAQDVANVLAVSDSDKLLAMLPPFHSFGLLAGLALPAASGIATVYHPNPTESAQLAALIHTFKVTLLGATPTFLEALLGKARENGLPSLRFAFVGAEKCPAHVYKAFAELCPQAALCEGYGITECSPVVAVNRPRDILAGSVGQALPSVECAVVTEEEEPAASHHTGSANAQDTRRRVHPGDTGMLLVRGPSIFSGYLTYGEKNTPDPFTLFEGERWYCTGDLIAMDANGRIFFKGRRKRFIKTGGEMISLPQMEDVLQQAFSSHPELPEDGAPFIAVEPKKTHDDGDTAELVACTTLDLSVQDINTALRKAGLSPLYAVRHVLRVPAIPLLGTGKVDYRTLSSLL